MVELEPNSKLIILRLLAALERQWMEADALKYIIEHSRSDGRPLLADWEERLEYFLSQPEAAARTHKAFAPIRDAVQRALDFEKMIQAIASVPKTGKPMDVN